MDKGVIFQEAELDKILQKMKDVVQEYYNEEPDMNKILLNVGYVTGVLDKYKMNGTRCYPSGVISFM